MNMFERQVGAGNPVFIIAEAGLNHNGDFNLAKRMVEVARDCGADAVKFQKRDMETLYRPSCLAAPSEASVSLGVYVPILRRCEFTEEQHADLAEHCRSIGIRYLCSPWDVASVAALERVGVEAYKVPSACLSDVYLADAIKFTGKPAIFSTGMHTAHEVEDLVKKYAFLFCGRAAFLHCVSSYPTANRDVNLGCMEWLRTISGGAPVGFSGHERGIPITVAAVAMGASIVERHFTMDRTMQGPDHAASLEPHGLETLVRHVRAVEEAMGSKKVMNRGEIVSRETIGKCLCWSRNHAVGERLDRSSFTASSPGYGVSVAKVVEWERAAGNFGIFATCETVAGEPVSESQVAHGPTMAVGVGQEIVR